MPKHYKFGPSSASRWLKCSASVDGGCDRPREFAVEGTVAHDIVEACWLFGTDPEDFLGEKHEVDGFTIEVTQEMIDAVNVFVRYIRDLHIDAEVLQSHSERQVAHNTLKQFGGTLDHVLITPDKNRVIDYKHGAGVSVDVAENAQLSCYALLLCNHDLDGDFHDVELTVIQPRVNHPDGHIRSWVATADYLRDFYGKVQDVVESEERTFNAGDHCRWCPRMTDCPELYRIALETAKADFDTDLMTPERAAEVMEHDKAISDYVKEVKAWAKHQADLGVEIPGYKLVKAFGNRAYKVDEAEILKRCRKVKLGKRAIYKEVLLSPAQLEKVAGKELVSELVEKPYKGLSLVPLSDRRDAVERSTVEEDFEDCETL